ncbi:unnamed protein product [Arabidopsis lyrata]|nr:unnamed protein product [Arabidopsis lyrata]
MTRLLSRTFPSVKLRDFKTLKNSQTQVPISSSSSQQSQENSKIPKSKSWSVYLILSTTEPIKTYVGITTDFARRLKQHNGEIRGGAKASSAGRPWLCACIITGFTCLSQGKGSGSGLFAYCVAQPTIRNCEPRRVLLTAVFDRRIDGPLMLTLREQYRIATVFRIERNKVYEESRKSGKLREKLEKHFRERKLL